MKSLTLDDRKIEIMNSAKRYYPNCIFQLCIRHYLEKINRDLKIANIKIKIRSREKLIENLFDGTKSEYIPITRKTSIRKIIELTNEIIELEFKHELLIDFEIIIKSILKSKNFKIAKTKIYSLENYFWPKRFKMKNQYESEHINKIKKLITDFKENKKYLINFLKYPHLNIPNTTNLVEGMNSQLESRLTSIRGFETSRTADNYINSWILKRRFKKFTDCRNKFKFLNGKTPLECAGADISDIQCWIDFSKNLPTKKGG